MPWIQKPPKKETPRQEVSEHKELRAKAYNSTEWKKAREYHLRNNPLCAQCLKEGKVTAADQCHHKISPFNYKHHTINWELFLDDNNIESICAYHHGKEHSGSNTPSPQEIIEELDNLLK